MALNDLDRYLRRTFSAAILVGGLLIVSSESTLAAVTGQSNPAPNINAAKGEPAIRFHRRSNSTSLILFVHGFVGDADSTWKAAKSNKSWPAMIVDDDTFSEFDVAIYKYPSKVNEPHFAIDKIADHLRSWVQSTRIDKQYERLSIIAHSMGGLVIRHFLLKFREQKFLAPEMIYFLGTPTNGSRVADLASVLYRHDQIAGLKTPKLNDALQVISSQWRASPMMSEIRSYCAYETQKAYGVIIVPETSATVLCNKRPDPIPADHFELAKPVNTFAEVYIAYKVAFEETYSTLPQTTESNLNSILKENATDLLMSSPALFVRLMNASITEWKKSAGSDLTTHMHVAKKSEILNTLQLPTILQYRARALIAETKELRLDYLLAAYRHSPYDPSVQFEIGLAYIELSNFKAAMEFLKRASKEKIFEAEDRYPYRLSIQSALASAAHANADYEQALSGYQSIIDILTVGLDKIDRDTPGVELPVLPQHIYVVNLNGDLIEEYVSRVSLMHLHSSKSSVLNSLGRYEDGCKAAITAIRVYKEIASVSPSKFFLKRLEAENSLMFNFNIIQSVCAYGEGKVAKSREYLNRAQWALPMSVLGAPLSPLQRKQYSILFAINAMLLDDSKPRTALKFADRALRLLVSSDPTSELVSRVAHVSRASAFLRCDELDSALSAVDTALTVGKPESRERYQLHLFLLKASILVAYNPPLVKEAKALLDDARRHIESYENGDGIATLSIWNSIKIAIAVAEENADELLEVLRQADFYSNLLGPNHPFEKIQRAVNERSETPRVLKRLQTLRRWSYEQIKPVFP